MEDYDEYMKKRLARVKQENFGFGRARQQVGGGVGVTPNPSAGCGQVGREEEEEGGLVVPVVSGEGVSAGGSGSVAVDSGCGSAGVASEKEASSLKVETSSSTISAAQSTTDEPANHLLDGGSNCHSDTKFLSTRPSEHTTLASSPFLIPVPNHSGSVFATLLETGSTSGSGLAETGNTSSSSNGIHREACSSHDQEEVSMANQEEEMEMSVGQRGNGGGESESDGERKDEGGDGDVGKGEGGGGGVGRGEGGDGGGRWGEGGRDESGGGDRRGGGVPEGVREQVDVEDSQDGQNVQNMLSSLVYSLGLNELETKQIISLWHNRTMIPPLDPSHLSRELARREQLFREEQYNFELQNKRALLRAREAQVCTLSKYTPVPCPCL